MAEPFSNLIQTSLDLKPIEEMRKKSETIKNIWKFLGDASKKLFAPGMGKELYTNLNDSAKVMDNMQRAMLILVSAEERMAEAVRKQAQTEKDITKEKEKQRSAILDSIKNQAMSGVGAVQGRLPLLSAGIGVGLVALLADFYNTGQQAKQMGAQVAAGAGRPGAGGLGLGRNLMQQGQRFGMSVDETQQAAQTYSGLGFSIKDVTGHMFKFGEMAERALGIPRGEAAQLADTLHEKLGVSVDQIAGQTARMFQTWKTGWQDTGIGQKEFINMIVKSTEELRFLGGNLANVQAIYTAFLRLGKPVTKGGLGIGEQQALSVAQGFLGSVGGLTDIQKIMVGAKLLGQNPYAVKNSNKAFEKFVSTEEGGGIDKIIVALGDLWKEAYGQTEGGLLGLKKTAPIMGLKFEKDIDIQNAYTMIQSGRIGPFIEQYKKEAISPVDKTANSLQSIAENTGNIMTMEKAMEQWLQEHVVSFLKHLPAIAKNLEMVAQYWTKKYATLSDAGDVITKLFDPEATLGWTGIKGYKASEELVTSGLLDRAQQHPSAFSWLGRQILPGYAREEPGQLTSDLLKDYASGNRVTSKELRDTLAKARITLKGGDEADALAREFTNYMAELLKRKDKGSDAIRVYISSLDKEVPPHPTRE